MNVRKLFTGFQRALVEAQAASRDQHRRQLEEYLDEDGRPRTLTIQLPESAADQETGRRSAIEVPLYALIPRSSLQMKDAEIELDVDLEWLSPKLKGVEAGSLLDLSQLQARAVGSAKGSGPKAKLRLRFEAARLSEEDLPTAELEFVETAVAK